MSFNTAKKTSTSAGSINGFIFRKIYVDSNNERLFHESVLIDLQNSTPFHLVLQASRVNDADLNQISLFVNQMRVCIKKRSSSPAL